MQSLCMCSCTNAAPIQKYDHMASGAGEGDTLDSTPPSPLPLNDASVPVPLQSPSTHTNPSRTLQHKGGVGKKLADKAHRQAKCTAVKSTQPGQSCPSLFKKHPKPHAISVDFNAKSLSAAKGASVSLCQKSCSAKEWTLQELVDEGLKVVKWDGR